MLIKQVPVQIDALHPNQKFILEEARRYTIVMCGRRFGKTVLIRYLFLKMFLGKRIGLFAPTFKDVKETWATLEQFALKINEIYGYKYIQIDNTARTMHIIKEGQTVDNAACLEVWSIKDEGQKEAGRGRKYHTIIYEETQKIKSAVLEHHWQKVARVMLTDYKGDAWFFGTAPNSKKHFFYELVCRGALNSELQHASDILILPSTLRNKNYMTFRMPTMANPYISKSEIEELRLELPELIFKQEVESICVEFAENPFCYVLNDAKVQERIFKKSIPYLQNVDTWISFDFNKMPMAAVLGQLGHNLEFIHRLKQFGSTTKVNIHFVCEQIRQYIFLKTGTKIGIWGHNKYTCPDSLRLYVTGDATGNTTDPRQQEGRTFYQIIIDELGMTHRNLKLFTSNPPHSESFLHINTYLEKHPRYFIDESQCPDLRIDMLNAQATAEKGIDKKAYDPHYLDTERYFLEAATPRKLPTNLYAQ